jgi:hypothetical protein
VFGSLGFAIFVGRAATNTGTSTSSLGLGPNIWIITLTIIAMYAAGHEMSRLAVLYSRHEGLIHGMAMFGVCAVLVLSIVMVSGIAMNNGAQASTPNPNTVPNILSLVAGLGWIGFVVLCLGWLAALLGATFGVVPPHASQPEARDMKTAA